MEMKSRKNRLIAFDFDGVICHSAPEMGASCFDAAIELVTSRGTRDTKIAEDRTSFLSFFEDIRPFLEVGYQGIVVALWFITPEIRQNLPLPPTDEHGAVWEEFLSTLISEVAARFPEYFPGEGMYKDTLTAMLGKKRDALLSANTVEWIDLNPIYDGMGELLQQLLADERNVISIVSTKQTRFIRTILEHASIRIDPSLIFGLEAGRKESVIANLLECYSPSFSCFIEDRVETLQRFAQDSRFKDLMLVFATWGYATPYQYKMGANDPRIMAVTQQSFAEMLCSR